MVISVSVIINLNHTGWRRGNDNSVVPHYCMLAVILHLFQWSRRVSCVGLHLSLYVSGHRHDCGHWRWCGFHCCCWCISWVMTDDALMSALTCTVTLAILRSPHLCHGYMWNKIMLKYFQRFISRVTTHGGCVWNKTLKLFQNYFSVLFRM